jgi:hypothetical protein
MDGQFDKLEELIYVESHLSNTSAKFYGEITQQMLKNSSFPGSNNGTGLLQTIIGLKVRRRCCCGVMQGGELGLYWCWCTSWMALRGMYKLTGGLYASVCLTVVQT